MSASSCRGIPEGQACSGCCVHDLRCRFEAALLCGSVGLALPRVAQ